MSINEGRRAAFMKGAKMIAGGAIGGQMIGQSLGQSTGLDVGLLQPASDYASDVDWGAIKSNGLDRPNPDWERREKAEKEIYAVKARQQEKQQRRWSLRQDAAIDEDLAALKSVSPWWRRQIMADRYAAQRTIQEQWEEKLRKLREAPGHMVDKMLSEFLAELSS